MCDARKQPLSNRKPEPRSSQVHLCPYCIIYNICNIHSFIHTHTGGHQPPLTERTAYPPEPFVSCGHRLLYMQTKWRYMDDVCLLSQTKWSTKLSYILWCDTRMRTRIPYRGIRLNVSWYRDAERDDGGEGTMLALSGGSVHLNPPCGIERALVTRYDGYSHCDTGVAVAPAWPQPFRLTMWTRKILDCSPAMKTVFGSTKLFLLIFFHKKEFIRIHEFTTIFSSSLLLAENPLFYIPLSQRNIVGANVSVARTKFWSDFIFYPNDDFFPLPLSVLMLSV